jgi:hypothetical protein
MSSRKAISDACSTVLARAPGKTLDFMPANFLAMPGPCSGKRLHGHSIAPDVHDDREGWRFDLGMGWPLLPGSHGPISHHRYRGYPTG